MSQQVKSLVAKPDYVSLILQINMVKEENQSHICPLTPPWAVVHWYTHTHTGCMDR